MKAKVAELEAQRPQPPDVEPDENDDLSADLSQAAQFAGTDPVARLATKQAKIIQKLERRIEEGERDSILVRQLDRMKLPEAKEKKVLEHFIQNKTRLGDMKAARAEVEQEELTARVEQLERENALLKRKPSEDDVTPNAPPTHGQSTGTRERKTEWTEEQFDTEANRVRSEKGELAYMNFLNNAPAKWRN